MTSSLVEIPLYPSVAPMPTAVAKFNAEGLRRSKEIDCFAFVPSSAAVLFTVLDNLPRCRFYEWGCGIGINLGIAEMLGFQSMSVEIDAPLASGAQKLLADFGLTAIVEKGNYFEIQRDSDLYFVYSWPGKIAETEAHFLSVAPMDAQLLICCGACDIRCKARPETARKLGFVTERVEMP